MPRPGSLSHARSANFYFIVLLRFNSCVTIYDCCCVQDDLHTCHGDLFSEAVSSVAESPQVTAVGVNCTHPKHVEVKMVN